MTASDVEAHHLEDHARIEIEPTTAQELSKVQVTIKYLITGDLMIIVTTKSITATSANSAEGSPGDRRGLPFAWLFRLAPFVSAGPPIVAGVRIISEVHLCGWRERHGEECAETIG